MLGISPSIFTDFTAARLVQMGYELEEKEKWIVVRKIMETGNIIYITCRDSDFSEAKEKGYKLINSDSYKSRG